MEFWISDFQANFSDWWLRYLLWNWPQMNVTGPYWWLVNIGSGNGLLPRLGVEAMILTQTCRHIASLSHNELKAYTYSFVLYFIQRSTYVNVVVATPSRRQTITHHHIDSLLPPCCMNRITQHITTIKQREIGRSVTRWFLCNCVVPFLILVQADWPYRAE